MRNCTECHRPSETTRGDHRIRDGRGNWLILIGKDEHLCPRCARLRGTRTLRKIHDSRKTGK